MSILGLGFVILVFSSIISSSSSQLCSAPSSFPSNMIFSACNDLPTLSSSLHWTFDASNATLSFAFTAPPAGDSGWVSWAINPTGEGMIGSQTLIAYRQEDGKMGVKTFNITDYAIRPSPIDFATADLAADFIGGVMRIYGKMFLAKGTTLVNQVWQVGAAVSNRIPVKHEFAPANLKAKGKLDLIRGQSTGTRDSTTRNRNIHGILNTVSWGILLPIGAIIARYLKIFKSTDPAWFYLHVTCQIIGYAVGVAGWGTGLNLGSKSKGVQYTSHRNIGITLFALGTLQIFALLLRPKKDHKYRCYWNIYHHSIGYTVIVLGIINVFKGLSILDPGNQWKISYIIFLCAYGSIALLLEVITWIIVLRRKAQKSTKLYDDLALLIMVAVAASPTPGAAAGSPFATRSHDHPPYKDMVLKALEALKGRKGTSRHAISKYISDNYSDLPPSHSSLLSGHLRRLQSKGVIRLFKHYYTIVDQPAYGNSGADVTPKKRGRPRKNPQPIPSVLDKTPKKRGRPPKLGADATPAKKMKPDRLPNTEISAVVDTPAVYILPQAQQLNSGFLQSLPGAVAIVLPEGLLSKKTAKSPILILPNGVQSLVDSSAGKKKLGRQKKIEVEKKSDQLKVVEKRQPGPSRRKAMLPRQVLVQNGDANVSHINVGAKKKLGRPRKSRDSVLHENAKFISFGSGKLATNETAEGALEKSGRSIIESVQALLNYSSPELKQRTPGRSKKNAIVEGLKSSLTTANAN